MINIENFSKYGWTVPLKNKIGQAGKDSFESILITSKRKPHLIETDRESNFIIFFFQIFLKINNIKLYSRSSSIGSVFAERFNCTIRSP